MIQAPLYNLFPFISQSVKLRPGNSAYLALTLRAHRWPELILCNLGMPSEKNQPDFQEFPNSLSSMGWGEMWGGCSCSLAHSRGSQDFIIIIYF